MGEEVYHWWCHPWLPAVSPYFNRERQSVRQGLKVCPPEILRWWYEGVYATATHSEEIAGLLFEHLQSNAGMQFVVGAQQEPPSENVMLTPRRYVSTQAPVLQYGRILAHGDAVAFRESSTLGALM